MTDPTESEAAFLVRACRILQAGGESFPSVLQRFLAAVEDAWPPLRASVSLAGGVSLVTGRSEFPSGGKVDEVPIVRGGKTLGSLSFESPAGADPADTLPAALGQALALLVGQEAELRRLAGLSAPQSQGPVGSSGVMQEVLRLVERGAGSTVPVLLMGEPGVGKHLLAAHLHRRSPVSRGPFVPFNGKALPESMVEGELFGHPRGSGGRFAEARGGTLFVNEVGQLSPAVQARLRRSLDGGPLAPRLVASTTRDLAGLVEGGKFLPGLHQRLASFPILVPPLRDRGSDIIALADHFVARSGLQTGKDILRISTPALEMLLSYPWPGNVRELETVIERAVLLSDDEVIHGFHLPPSLQSSVHSGTRMHGRLVDRLDSLEYEMLVEALKSSQGNITQAGRELGLSKRIMGLRLKKFELDYRTFRQGPTDLAEDQDWN